MERTKKPRISRLFLKTQPTVMTPTTLEGFPLCDTEKEYMLNLIKRQKKLYFIEILGFCLISSNIHIVVRMNHVKGRNKDNERMPKDRGGTFSWLGLFGNVIFTIQTAAPYYNSQKDNHALRIT